MIKPDIEVEMTFVPTAEGGRTYPVRSGFQIIHDFYGEPVFNDAMHTYLDKEEVYPGQSTRAHLSLMYRKAHIGRMSVGQTFLVREGGSVIAHGKILEIFDPSLEKSAG